MREGGDLVREGSESVGEWVLRGKWSVVRSQ